MNFSHKDAFISECRTYRYMLERRWTLSPRIPTPMPFVLWIMLNPSIADGTIDDPTLRKCARFTELWGFKRLILVNLYAFRATEPRLLRSNLAAKRDIVGPDNDHWISAWLADRNLGQVIVAWGNNPIKNTRHKEVTDLINQQGRTPYMLKRNETGHPHHPLFASYEWPLQIYNP